jgi:hypothetical protein
VACLYDFILSQGHLGVTLLVIEEECFSVGLLAFPLSANFMTSLWLWFSSSASDAQEHRHSQLAFRKHPPLSYQSGNGPRQNPQSISLCTLFMTELNASMRWVTRQSEPFPCLPFFHIILAGLFYTLCYTQVSLRDTSFLSTPTQAAAVFTTTLSKVRS